MENVTKIQKFSERLQALRERRGSKQEEMADFIGVSLKTYWNWENQKTFPSVSQMRNLCVRLQVPLDYFTGEEQSIAITRITSSGNAKEQPSSGIVERVEKALTRVPVVSWAHAGACHDYTDMCNQIDEWLDFDAKDPNAFALILEGDCMEPRFHAGDRVIFYPNSEPRNGDFVVARLLSNHGVLFRRYRRMGPEGTKIRLEPLNPEYTSMEYLASDFRFIYPAVEFRAALRR